MSVNKVILIGLVGKDPEIRSMGNGGEVASFSMATSESWKDKATGEKKEKTEWHNIVVYGSLVSVIKNYVHKGSKLYIEGALLTTKWTDKNGVDKYKTDIVLQGYGCKLEMLDGKNTEAKPKEEKKVEKEDLSGQVEDDDIPF